MQTQVRPRVANAPLSYGAFEITVGTDFLVPDPEDVLGAIGDAGYAGTDLGPPGYLGEGRNAATTAARQPARPRRRLRARALQRTRALGRRPRRPHGTRSRSSTPRKPTNARPVLCDAGGPERIANPGRGGEDAGLRLTTAAGRRWSTASRARAEIARTAGYEPVFHHHTSSYVEGLPEIERFLADTDIDLLLDSGHLAVAGGDPIQGLRTGASASASCTSRTRAWTCSPRSATERADMISAWRRGLFCALGDGDVDLVGFCAELDGYDGWVVIEQDRVLEGNGAFAHAAQEQRGNREWLREHAGW